MMRGDGHPDPGDDPEICQDDDKQTQRMIAAVGRQQHHPREEQHERRDTAQGEELVGIADDQQVSNRHPQDHQRPGPAPILDGCLVKVVTGDHRDHTDQYAPGDHGTREAQDLFAEPARCDHPGQARDHDQHTDRGGHKSE